MYVVYSERLGCITKLISVGQQMLDGSVKESCVVWGED